MSRRFFLLLVLFLGFGILAGEANPQPYGEDEFPQWMKDLRRAEIITFGSLPVTLYVSNLGYAAFKWGSNNFQDEYAFNFLGVSAVPLETGEKIGVVSTAVGLSLCFALVDYILEKSDEYGRRNK